MVKNGVLVIFLPDNDFKNEILNLSRQKAFSVIKTIILTESECGFRKYRDIDFRNIVREYSRANDLIVSTISDSVYSSIALCKEWKRRAVFTVESRECFDVLRALL